MARLHLTFRSIHRRTVKAAQTLFDSKPWSGSDEEKQNKFERFLRDAAEIYGVPTPTLSIVEGADHNGLVAPNTIILRKFSVTSLFHAFRAHLQYVGSCERQFYDWRDAQGWACSLFYTCRPILFRKQVRLRQIQGVYADDLLTSATLAARQDEVDEAFAGIVAESYSEQDIEDDDADGLDDAETPAEAPAEMVERLSVSDAATRLGVSESTVRNMLNDGRLRGERDGRRVVVLYTPAAS